MPPVEYSELHGPRLTAAEFTAQNPVLPANVIGQEKTPPHKVKLGDGSTAWNDLPYLTASGGSGTSPWSSTAFAFDSPDIATGVVVGTVPPGGVFEEFIISIPEATTFDGDDAVMHLGVVGDIDLLASASIFDNHDSSGDALDSAVSGSYGVERVNNGTDPVDVVLAVDDGNGGPSNATTGAGRVWVAIVPA